jgi:hypothetical protein
MLARQVFFDALGKGNVMSPIPGCCPNDSTTQDAADCNSDATEQERSGTERKKRREQTVHGEQSHRGCKQHQGEPPMPEGSYVCACPCPCGGPAQDHRHDAACGADQFFDGCEVGESYQNCHDDHERRGSAKRCEDPAEDRTCRARVSRFGVAGHGRPPVSERIGPGLSRRRSGVAFQRFGKWNVISPIRRYRPNDSTTQDAARSHEDARKVDQSGTQQKRRNKTEQCKQSRRSCKQRESEPAVRPRSNRCAYPGPRDNTAHSSYKRGDMAAKPDCIRAEPIDRHQNKQGCCGSANDCEGPAKDRTCTGRISQLAVVGLDRLPVQGLGTRRVRGRPIRPRLSRRRAVGLVRWPVAGFGYAARSRAIDANWALSAAGRRLAA